MNACKTMDIFPLSFCYGDEESGHRACTNGHLTSANQSEICKAYLVSVPEDRKLFFSDGGIHMNLLQFAEAVKMGLGKNFDDGTQITINSVRKNNGVLLTGVVIMEKNSNIAPTIYLESFYEEFKRGKELKEVVSELVQVYRKNRIKHCDELDFFHDYQTVERKIFYKLINADKNKELLKEVPYVSYLDLAIVFYCDCSSELFGSAAILIKNNHIKMWGVSVDKVYQAAMDNTPKNKPYEIKTMEEVMKELFAADIRKELEKSHISFSEKWVEEMAAQMLASELPAEGRTPMYILTNTERLHGAACMLYQRLIEDFAKKLNDNLYILPSSVHEIIMIPASFAGKASQLKEMVEEINATQVEAEEVLSDSVYFFNRLTKKLEMV